MERRKLVLVLLFSVLVMSLCSGCEVYAVSDEINGLIRHNDLSISMKVVDDLEGFSTEGITENGDDYYLKIDVVDTYTIRGQATIQPGEKYKLTFVLKNIDADPVICYSFWKQPKTSLRNYTFKGENGNPPTSETQEPTTDWVTFEETFQTQQGEDSFMLVLISGKGTFYIKDIRIELVH